ncbi:hypothetical protein RvY_13927 [Ramazzottius varieornatus]|uniref:N-acetyltransferase domain-containing protein n=1 Tax=Ramazzottius varieornatus TaxID=947166 RepID=A0A1D1VUQ9_RAMVA|nr:hypothetical protein RvY_13927 [Ramazzottius varieornatus]
MRHRTMDDALLQNLLSGLSLNGQVVSSPSTAASLHPDGGLSDAYSKSFHPRNGVSEYDRQKMVEAERNERIMARKQQLVELGQSRGIHYVTYGGEDHLHQIMDLITRDFSEPYSIYTYRYFIYQWPKLCHLALNADEKVVGAIVCKMENTKSPFGAGDPVRRGYIAMLAVDKSERRAKIGTALVVSAVESLMNYSCDEVVLETETTNQAALRLYENLGFARHKRLLKYYLNGVDAFRLKLWLRFPPSNREKSSLAPAQTGQATQAEEDSTATVQNS